MRVIRVLTLGLACVAAVGLADKLTPTANATEAQQVINGMLEAGSRNLVVGNSLMNRASFGLFENAIDLNNRLDLLPFHRSDMTTRYLSRPSGDEDDHKKLMYTNFTNLGESDAFQYGGVREVNGGNIGGFLAYQTWDTESRFIEDEISSDFDSHSDFDRTSINAHGAYGWQVGSGGGVGIGLAYADHETDNASGFQSGTFESRARSLDESSYLKLQGAYGSDPWQDQRWGIGAYVLDGEMNMLDRSTSTSPFEQTERLDFDAFGYGVWGRYTQTRGDHDWEIWGKYSMIDLDLNNRLVFSDEFSGFRFEERFTSDDTSISMAAVGFRYLDRVNDKVDFATGVSYGMTEWDSSFRGDAFSGDPAMTLPDVGDINTSADLQLDTLMINTAVRYWVKPTWSISLAGSFDYRVTDFDTRDVFTADDINERFSSEETHTGSALALASEWYLTPQVALEMAFLRTFSQSISFEGGGPSFSPGGVDTLDSDQLSISARITF